MNRNLSRLRAVFNWAVRVGYLDRTPFKRGPETVIKLSPEIGRSRRLRDDEEDCLLSTSHPHLRSLIIAAVETGMRRGELLNLRWRQIEGLSGRGPEIALQARQTKTRRDRRVPISGRLRAMLDMRRTDPAGLPLPPDARVFGSEAGERVKDVKRAWQTAVLKSHGYRPRYTATGQLDETSRKSYRRIDLHFHDLCREAGSRWLEGGVPLHVVRDWLGHANVAQTSTYLATTARTQHDAMRQFEERRASLQRIATDTGTEGNSGTQSDNSRHATPYKNTVGHETGAM